MADSTDKQTVTATEFKQSVGAYMEISGKKPVFITKHRRPVRVLIDAEEYDRLKRRDTRQAHSTGDAPADHIQMVTDADYGPIDPDLEKLME